MVSHKIPEVVMRILMGDDITFKIKHECILILITLLFEGNEMAQNTCLKFAKDNDNSDFLKFL